MMSPAAPGRTLIVFVRRSFKVEHLSVDPFNSGDETPFAVDGLFCSGFCASAASANILRSKKAGNGCCRLSWHLPTADGSLDAAPASFELSGKASFLGTQSPNFTLEWI